MSKSGAAPAKNQRYQEEWYTVLDALSRNKAMSVVELMSDFDIPDSELMEIINDLKRQDLVVVSGEGLDQIVTIRESRLRAAGD